MTGGEATAGRERRTIASPERRLLTVLANETLGAYRVLSVADPDGPKPVAGQFAMLASAERWGAGEDERPFLPRAFSYARWTDGVAQFVLEDVGPGTRRLCETQPGEGLLALGPLGVGFSPPSEGRRALLVGGGVGIAPLLIWQDELRGATSDRQTHNRLVSDLPPLPPTAALLGFRDAPRARGADLFDGAARAPRVVTDDGSVGKARLVTDLLEEELDADSHATVYSCGPPAMLEAVRAICARRGVPCELALESGMACGFGACYGCVVPTAEEGYLRVCIDGPVVDGALLARVDAHAGAPA